MELYAQRNVVVRRLVITHGLSYSEAARRVGEGLTRNAVAGIVNRTSPGERKRLETKREELISQ